MSQWREQSARTEFLNNRRHNVANGRTGGNVRRSAFFNQVLSGGAANLGYRNISVTRRPSGMLVILAGCLSLNQLFQNFLQPFRADS